MKTLKELLLPSEILESSVDFTTRVVEITQDSRLAKAGGLFVAVRGTQSDGHQFVKEVVSKGCIAVVDKNYALNGNEAVIKVNSTRDILGPIASRFWGEPTNGFTLIGITGTNGKTTTTFLLDQIWTQMGLVTGLIGTVKNKIAQEILESSLTTPGPIELQALFHRMSQRRVEFCSMEVSSIALDQSRTRGSYFRVGVFTNFTQDHLDYHHTMENYLEAKLKLFRDYDLECVVVNDDDPASQIVLSQSKSPRKITFSMKNREASFFVEEAQFKTNGTVAKVHTPFGVRQIRTPLIGAHNLMNVLGVMGVIVGVRQDLDKAIKFLETAQGAPGRLERAILGEYYPNVFVDYAHSDDALENVLKALHQLRGGARGKIITVFGCGGDRDRTKRPKMAKVASSMSDITIATSDNPRTEDPEAILNDIETGIERSKTEYHREVNRREAIYLALKLAKSEDIVLIAGKGHENYQILGTQKQDFDDKQVVKDYFSA